MSAAPMACIQRGRWRTTAGCTTVAETPELDAAIARLNSSRRSIAEA